MSEQDMGFTALIQNLEAGGGAYETELPDSWTQGRTAYGGLSAALCVEAARRALPDLPPLRSAQFAFAGPAAGRLRAVARLVRQGRSAAVVAVDLDGEAGPAVRAILTCGAARESAIAHDRLSAPGVPGPDGCEPFFPPGFGPKFARHFDMRLADGARPFSGGAPSFTLWVRHRGADGVDPLVALVALGDAPPPAAMVGFTQPGAISTMTWSLDLLGEPAGPAGGWRLLRSTSDQAADGYSSQAMMLWDADGRPLAISRQTVAIFV